MSAITDRIRSDWAAKVGGELQCVEVPEWGEGDVPLKIYYRPMNLAQQDAVYKHIANNSLQALVEQLIQRARTEADARMFTKGDTYVLMNSADPAVINRIVAAMADEPDGDAAKN